MTKPDEAVPGSPEVEPSVQYVRRSEAKTTSSPALRGKLLSDLLSVFIVYLIIALGSWFYANEVLQKAPAFPQPDETLPLVLLALLPIALLGVFVIRVRRLIIELRQRKYGSRLRLRLSLLFLAVAAAASLPQGAFLLRLAQTAMGNAAAEVTKRGIGSGLDLVLGYYDEDLRRLEYAATRDLPTLAAGRLPGLPERILEELKGREPRFEALEWWKGGIRSAFAGESAARLGSAPGAGAKGFMPATSSAGARRLRYATPLQGGTAVLTLKLPADFDRTTGDLAQAKRTVELMDPFSRRWAGLLGLFYAFFVVPLMVLAILFGIAAADFVAEPLAGLEEATKRVAHGDYDIRLLVKPGDETGRLVASFNRMLSEIERYRFDELRKEKIDAWKDIAQRLAHELKNPLTPIRLAAERLLRAKSNDPARALEILDGSMLAVVAEVEGMDALLKDFRAFASLPEPQRDWAELAPLVEDSVALYRASYPSIHFSLEDIPTGLTLRVDRAQFKRALGNIFANAIDAMNGKGEIDIRADLVKTSDSRYCRLRVRDTGKGIPKELGARVFSPYFTTKSAGTGLGLSIVERIVTDHGGSIRFESEEGVGTSFYIDLPLER